MNRPLRLAAAFFRRDLLVDWSYRGNLFFGLAGALFSLWSLYFVGKTFGGGSPLVGGDYFRFALVGVAFSVPMRAGMAGVSRRVRELQLHGSLEPLVAAPVPPLGSMLLLALYPLAAALGRGAAFFALGVAFFGASFPEAQPLAALLGLVLGLAAYAGMGVISAAVVLVIKRGDPFAWAVDALTFLLAGVFFPVQVLPGWLHPLSDLIPATHSLAVLRGSLLQGQGLSALAGHLVALAAFAALALGTGALALRAALAKAARDGSLGHA